ncbi:hypothetical protein BD626DRAFT_555455 [Schizophyllum amplum]|uniref:Uncharacterized protein n=1 Tax=Schizophyllum amplum TaxID=97359 RepID=A0A550CPG1_9AGAR|nr:hypothetical protein BD626DRAFT_555455 [Auriculariopsis ampla]
MPHPRAVPRLRQSLKQSLRQCVAITPQKSCSPHTLSPVYGLRQASSLSAARAFSTSPAARIGSSSYNDDNVVPDFYVQRKEKRAAGKGAAPVADDKKRDPSLMEHLSDGLLSDEIVASTRRLKSKIPKEMYNEDGVLVHPSGFVIPTPSVGKTPARRERERDLAKQTAAVAERVLEEDFGSVSAHTKAKRRKVPVEVTHQDGSVSHPSGFVPPTPADSFDNLFAWEDAENANSEAQARLRNNRPKSSGEATHHQTGMLQEQPSHTSGTAAGGAPTATSNPRSTQTDPGDSTSRSRDDILLQEQRESIQRRKEQEGGLMTELTAGVLAGGVSASTEPRDGKKPTAFKTEDGVQTAQHPPEFIEQHPPPEQPKMATKKPE